MTPGHGPYDRNHWTALDHEVQQVVLFCHIYLRRIKILLFDKNCHILILIEKEPFFTRDTNLSLLTPLHYYTIHLVLPYFQITAFLYFLLPGIFLFLSYYLSIFPPVHPKQFVPR